VTDPGRAARLRALFDGAAAIPAPERPDFLERHCGDEPDLRAELEELLACLEEAHSEDLGAGLLAAPRSLVGSRIGPYLLREEIGHGGMGMVYRAERDDVGLVVALKVLREGRLATPEQVARFLFERRILARLQHPHIARLLDAGITEQGLPYLVMERVDGEPIDRYCDERRLPLEARLRLFVEVCRAVQDAPRSLIVHRDLKPANILVTTEGVPKLLDFGVAKLIEDENAEGLTRTVPAPLTPEYATPEQVRGGAITTATDVYALGAIAYELLTGRRPFRIQVRTPQEIERVVCGTDPPRPSAVVLRDEGRGHDGEGALPPAPGAVAALRRTTPQRLSRRLSGELDTIVLKALHKEPERRYPTVAELADDIERELAGMPVRARPDTVAYRARRFLSRHRYAVTGATAVVLALAVGLATALWQYREAQLQRDRAIRVANAMMDETASGLSRMAGPRDAVRGLLDRAVMVYEEVAREEGGRPELQRQAAEGRRRLSLTYFMLGDTALALRYALDAERRARRLVSRRGATAADRALLAGVLVQLGDAFAARGRSDAAVSAYTEAIARADSVTRAPGVSTSAYRTLYLALSRSGDYFLEAEQQTDRAERLYRRAHEAAARLTRAEPTSAEFAGYFATSLDRLGDVLYYGRESTAAACLRYRQALAVRGRSTRTAPDDVAQVRALANEMQNVAWCDDWAGDQQRAIQGYDSANAVLSGLLRTDPANTVLGALFIGGVGELAGTLAKRGDLRGALARYREALAAGEAFRARGNASPRVLIGTARVAREFAAVLLQAGEWDEAERVLSRARACLVQSGRSGSVEVIRSEGDVATTAGDLARARGDAHAAVQDYDQALERYQRVAAASSTPSDRREVAAAHYRRALALEADRQVGPARAALLQGNRILLELREAGQLSAEESEALRGGLVEFDASLRRLDRGGTPRP
jgi:serine/threonine protein kinase/tetratricopeptide (TPR) repeat protein